MRKLPAAHGNVCLISSNKDVPGWHATPRGMTQSPARKHSPKRCEAAAPILLATHAPRHAITLHFGRYAVMSYHNDLYHDCARLPVQPCGSVPRPHPWRRQR